MKVMEEKSGRRISGAHKSDVVGSSETASSRSTPSTSRSSTPNNVKDQGRDYDAWRSLISQISPLAKNTSVTLAMQSIDMEEPNEELKEECLNHLRRQFEEFKQDLAGSLTSRLSERLETVEKEKIQDFRACLEKCDKKMRFELVTGKLLSDDHNNIRAKMEQRKAQLLQDRRNHYADVYGDNFSSDVENELRRSMKHYEEGLRKVQRSATTEGRISNKVRLEITETKFQSYTSTYEQASDQDQHLLKSFANDYLKQETMKRDEAIYAAFERDAKTIRRELEQLKKMTGNKKTDRRSSVCVIS